MRKKKKETKIKGGKSIIMEIKRERGITLVALVITIIIIIILATVTINMAFGDNGLIKQAEIARDLTINSTEYETQATSNLVAYMNEMLYVPEKIIKVKDVKGGKAFAKKTTVEDEQGNKIKVPAGFKIASDSGDTVQQGIVIEDVNASTDSAVQGSQFVWIPLGIFMKDGGTPSNEIILGRYTFNRSSPATPELQQAAYTNDNLENYKISKPINSYYEELSTYRVGSGADGLNATAYNLGEWVKSARENGGYYMGRYEASYASGTSIDNYKAATTVSNGSSETQMTYSTGTLWNFISQIDASKIAINTYANSASVKSDLINSYAWDTAIVFIQECGKINYANQIGYNINTKLTNTGTGQDEECKINDMASNLQELTTEYNSGDNNKPGSYRGGYWVHMNGFTANRLGVGLDKGYNHIRFSS